MSAQPDVVVIGGGVIGLSTAYELARSGMRVRLIDQTNIGQEASWAGAGMLPPGEVAGAKTTEALWRAHSHRLWRRWAHDLVESTGQDIGYRRCGAIEVRAHLDAAALRQEIAGWHDEGVAVEELAPNDWELRFPAVDAEGLCGYWLPDFCQVRNPRLLKALAAACQAWGVELSPGVALHTWQQATGRITSIQTSAGELHAAAYVLSTGTWSQPFLSRVGCELGIEPVRGQIVLLEQRAPTFDYVIQSGPRYLVPRGDGRVLIGSTEERAGFQKETTAAGIAELLSFGQRYIPGLHTARFERSWSGLRPYRTGGLPYVGRAPAAENLILAVGHFRAGLQLSPITAVTVRQLLRDEPLALPQTLLNQ